MAFSPVVREIQDQLQAEGISWAPEEASACFLASGVDHRQADTSSFVDDLTLVGATARAADCPNAARRAVVITAQAVKQTGITINFEKNAVMFAPVGTGSRKVQQEVWSQDSRLLESQDLPEPVAIKRIVKSLGTMISDKGDMTAEVANTTSTSWQDEILICKGNHIWT